MTGDDDSGDDDYRPRAHDHLVEPVFGGLGVEPRPESCDNQLEARRGLRGIWLRFVHALVSRVRSSKPAGGR